MKIFNVAVLGCGNISSIYLRNLSEKFDNLRVYAVSDLVSEKVENAKKICPDAKVMTLDEILVDENVDIVLNLTTPPSHYQLCRKILEAGKHVYMEKPLALKYAEGKKLVNLANSKNLYLGCAPDTFMGAGIQTCKYLIDNGYIGKVVGMTASMMSRGHEHWHPDPEFYYKQGGGPMFDMGPYYLTALVYLLGKVKHVLGMSEISRPTRTITSKYKYGETIDVEVATHVVGLLRFESGAIGTITTSFDTLQSQLPRIEIYGTKGVIYGPDPNTFGGPVFLKTGDEELKEFPLISEFSGQMRGMGLSDMANAIANNTRDYAASGENALHVLDIMEKILTCSGIGRERYFHDRNNELTYKDEPLVRENCFLRKPVTSEPLPVFEDIAHRLPIPVWENHSDYLDCYRYTWKLAFGNLRAPVPGTGFVSNFIDTAFNGCLFMWDTAFILMFCKYADRIIKFQESLDNMYSHQHRDGYICREINELTGLEHFTRHDPSSTGPQVMAWCEWEYYKNFGDTDRLARVFPPLMAYHRWMAANRTWPDGTYFSSGYGCGMDNVPRLMPGYSIGFDHGHMVWVDACMQALYDCRILIDMARALHREEFIPELEQEQTHLEQVINEKLWDEDTGFYYDLWKDGRLNMVRHVGAYWALLAWCASPERAERMIALLNDEKTFKTPNRIPSLAKDHPDYSPVGNAWKGAVWAPTNYMVLKGLDLYGRSDLSHEIAAEYLSAVVETFQTRGTVYENYAPEYVNGRPDCGQPSNADFVGWTGLAPIAVLFEYVFGIKPEADRNKILWDINLLEEHGVKQYPFGTEGILTLLCKARTGADEKPQITIESNVPVTLEIHYGEPGSRKQFIIQV